MQRVLFSRSPYALKPEPIFRGLRHKTGGCWSHLPGLDGTGCRRVEGSRLLDPDERRLSMRDKGDAGLPGERLDGLTVQPPFAEDRRRDERARVLRRGAGEPCDGESSPKSVSTSSARHSGTAGIDGGDSPRSIAAPRLLDDVPLDDRHRRSPGRRRTIDPESSKPRFCPALMT